MKITKKLLEKAIAKLDSDIAILQTEKNTQIKEMVMRKKAERAAFEACLQSLSDNHLLLNLYV